MMPQGRRWSTREVGAPHLRELEVGVGERELVAAGRRAGHGRRLVAVRIGVERPRGRVVQLLEAGEHAGVADLVGDPDVGRRPVKMPVPPRTCVLRLAVDVPVEADARRPQDVRDRAASPVEYCTVRAVLVAERQRVGGRVLEAGLAELRHVEPDAGGAPSGCRSAATRPGRRRRVVPDLERLQRLLQAGMLIQRTWKRRSVTGDIVRFGFARKSFASA